MTLVVSVNSNVEVISLKLTPSTIDPVRLMKPTSVADRLKVHASMVTHWMQDDHLDFVEIDGVKFIPEESVAVLQALRQKKAEDKALRLAVEQGEFASLTV